MTAAVSDDHTAPVAPEQAYLTHLREGRFMLPRRVEDGSVFFPPRAAAPASGDLALDWVAASGRGTIYSTSVVRQRPPAADYNIALVDLAEGPRMMARVVGIAPEDVRIGMHVTARIVDDEGVPLVVFDPV